MPKLATGTRIGKGGWMKKKRLLTVMGNTNKLNLAIKKWQTGGTSIFAGGMVQSTWLGTANGGGHADGRTFISPAYGVSQTGQITGWSFYAKSAFNTPTGTDAVKLKIFRYNAGTSQYDFVSESEGFIVSANAGAKTYTLATPISVNVGDVVGFYMPTAAGGIGLSNPKTTQARYVNGDIITSNAFTLQLNYGLEIEIYMKRPYFAVTGDSIVSGSNAGAAYYGRLANVAIPVMPGGTITSEPMYQLRQLIPTLNYQNCALGSMGFSWVATVGFPACVAIDPSVVIIHAGVNDVSGGASWETISGYLDTIKAAAGTISLLIDEILPWTAGTDEQAATIRTYNGNLATWCAANSATLILCHDEMGQVRAGTGEIDDLLTAYNQDNVHITAAGVAKMAEIWKRYL